MKLLARCAGSGWLRAEGFGSATAAYDFKIFKHISGPHIGQLTTDGRLLSDIGTMIEASAKHWATLILANGRSVKIDVRSVSSNGMEFTLREPIPDNLD